MGVSIGDLKRQLALEDEAVQYSILRYRKQLHGDQKKPTPLSELPPGSRLMRLSMEPMIDALRAFKEKSGRGSGRFLSTLKLFRLLPNEEIAFITAKVIINSFTMSRVNGEYIQGIALRLGQSLIDQYEYKTFKEQNPGYIYVLEKQMKYSTSPHRKRVITASQNRIGIKGLIEFDKSERLAIGMRAITMFAESTGMVTPRRVKMKRGKDTPVVLEPTPEVDAWLADAHSKCELLQPIFYPMIIPPKPWTSIDDGGYMSPLSKVKMIKVDNPKAKSAIKNLDMPEVYSAINKLQDVRWAINSGVLKVMKELWQAGGDIAGLPCSDLEPLPKKPWNDSDNAPAKDVLRMWKQQAADVYIQRVRNRSKRIATGMKISLAEKFMDEEAIYFVWASDFRGRVYPLQGFVNPQADDAGRSLLRFADGVKLDQQGAYWLAIHGANCFGVDKVSFPERYKWVSDNEKEIYKCGIDALNNLWWTEADEPWQFLAFCIEWSRWMDYGLDCVSYLPVAMDGTCNGLQHLSALLLDGSAPVNLLPGNKPQDIYQEVADVLIEMVQADADKGVPEAIIWQGKITRKTTKRAVMCTPYGLKKYGLRTQLKGDLEKIKENYLEIDGDSFEAIRYYAEKLHDAIGTVVTASRQVMDWLHEVAKVTVQAGIPIKWTTPSGFLVHQEYAKEDTLRINTYFGENRIRVSMKESKWDNLDSRRAVQGISPNYIHSNDASHLMSVINAWDSPITTIHDSIGAHASMIPELHETIRETFVQMYSTNQLERFRKEVVEQLPANLKDAVPPTPQQGDLDISVVKNSPYFFA